MPILRVLAEQGVRGTRRGHGCSTCKMHGLEVNARMPWGSEGALLSRHSPAHLTAEGGGRQELSFSGGLQVWKINSLVP